MGLSMLITCQKEIKRMTFLEECNISLFKQKIELYLTSLEIIANTQKGLRRERADKLLDLYRQGSDYELVQNWKKETKPVIGPSIHIHQVMVDNLMIGINNGSFNVNNMPKRNKEDDFFGRMQYIIIQTKDRVIP